MRLIPLTIALLSLDFSLVATTILPQANVFSVTTNCSGSSQPCGPLSTCCASGLECNYQYATPFCQDPNTAVSFGFDHDPCIDLYTFRCDEVLNIPGYCCPIGSSCLLYGDNQNISCVDALGTMSSAMPFSETNYDPPLMVVPSDNRAIVYAPSDAWTVSKSNFSCTTSSTIHSTSSINASISFNYTGPSIVINTVTSLSGGVFSVIVDGFDTTNLIDTYTDPGDLALPTCYPLQFPPFALPPPNYAGTKNHTLTLVYKGRSAFAPNGTNASTGAFDALAIPLPGVGHGGQVISGSSRNQDGLGYHSGFLGLIAVFIYVRFI